MHQLLQQSLQRRKLLLLRVSNWKGFWYLWNGFLFFSRDDSLCSSSTVLSPPRHFPRVSTPHYFYDEQFSKTLGSVLCLAWGCFWENLWIKLLCGTEAGRWGRVRTFIRGQGERVCVLVYLLGTDTTMCFFAPLGSVPTFCTCSCFWRVPFS